MRKRFQYRKIEEQAESDGIYSKVIDKLIKLSKK